MMAHPHIDKSVWEENHMMRNRVEREHSLRGHEDEPDVEFFYGKFSSSNPECHL